MNAFFIIILVALVLEYTLSLVANILNIKALSSTAPPMLREVYEPQEYQHSQEYTRTNTRFDILISTFNLILLISFWLAGGFNFLDQTIRSWGHAAVWNGLIFIGILLLAQSLISIPFSLYSTFVIEERFGFNKTTIGTFIKDRGKGLILVILIGAPLFAGILLLFEHLGNFAWLYCWIAVSLFSLVMQFIAPTWIMPLFNKFTPMPSGTLKDSILKYARSVKFPIKNVFSIDGSRRSNKANAFFTGFGRNKRIALFDTLIEKHAEAELVAVLAHEIGHYKKKHIIQGMIISLAHSGIIFFLLSLFLKNSSLFEAFFMEQQSIYAGLLFFGLLYTPIELLLSLALNVISRKNEVEADRFASETIDNPISLVDALKKLAASNLDNLAPHPFYVFLNYSHPPLLQRVEAIQQYSK